MWKTTSRPVINKTCTLTSRELQTSRLEILTYRLGLVSAGEANVSVSGGERLGLVLVSSFYVSCSSLLGMWWCDWDAKRLSVGDITAGRNNEGDDKYTAFPCLRSKHSDAVFQQLPFILLMITLSPGYLMWQWKHSWNNNQLTMVLKRIWCISFYEVVSALADRFIFQNFKKKTQN